MSLEIVNPASLGAPKGTATACSGPGRARPLVAGQPGWDASEKGPVPGSGSRPRARSTACSRWCARRAAARSRWRA
jgi:hypothetical protein